MKKLVHLLLNAPDSQIDATMKPLINKWEDPPKPIQVLEVLDHCIHGSLSSGMVVHVLQAFYYKLCEDNNTTHEEVVKLATWRND